MHARYLIDGTAHDVVATRGNDGSVQLRRGQRSLSVSREALPDGRWHIRIDGCSRTVHLAAGADAVYVHADGLGAVEVEQIGRAHV